MRLALIADTYPPLKTSGAVQMRDLAAELKRQGHEPCVITSDPELPGAWQLNVERGVDVLRLKTLRTKDVNYVNRTIAEFLLPFMMALRMRRSSLAAEFWDGVVWYSPNIFFGPLIRKLKRRCSCRSYLILRDIFPEWAVDAGLLRRGVVYRWFKWIERYQYSVADVIGVQSPSNLDYLSDWARDHGRKLEVLNNWLCDFDLGADGRSPQLQGLEGKTVFVYVGNMGVAQGMDSLMCLAQEFGSDPRCIFLFVGRGSEVPRLRDWAADKGLRNVRFEDEIDPDNIPALLRDSHIGLLALDPRHKTHNVPGKFLAYLHAGLPVLARINDGNDLKEVIEKESVGAVSTGSEPLDILYDQARTLAGDELARAAMGRRCLELGREMYSASTAAAQIVTAIRDGS